jgi:mono/diheme cytochrome c family protein
MRCLTVALAFAAALPPGWSPALAQDTVARGQRDYVTYCASCHGREARGDGPVAEFMAMMPADLTVLARNNGGEFPAERVAEVIDGRWTVKVHGTRDMPVWGDWFKLEAGPPETGETGRESTVQARIAALVAYLRSIQAP